MNRLKDHLRFRAIKKQEHKDERRKKHLPKPDFMGENIGIGIKFILSLFLLWGVISLYYHAISSILHYPETLSWVTFILILLIGWVTHRKMITVNLEESKIKIIAYGLEVTGRMVISYIAGLVVKTLICLYLLYLAPKDNPDLLTFPIESIKYYRRHHRYILYFQLDGASESIETKSEVVKNLYRSKGYHAYQVQLKVQRSLWGTYVLESWKIQEKATDERY